MTTVAVVGLAGSTAVTLTGVGDDLGVLDRRSVRTRDSQPYHEAQGRPIDEAERIIADAFDRAVGHATDDLGALLRDVRGRGFEVTLAGLSFRTYRLPASVEVRLRSHAMCHGGEGEMTRDALWAACDALGLTVHAEPPEEIPARIDTAGKAIGAPWRKEHKLAALAALAALRGH